MIEARGKRSRTVGRGAQSCLVSATCVERLNPPAGSAYLWVGQLCSLTSALVFINPFHLCQDPPNVGLQGSLALRSPQIGCSTMRICFESPLAGTGAGMWACSGIYSTYCVRECEFPSNIHTLTPMGRRSYLFCGRIPPLSESCRLRTLFFQAGQLPDSLVFCVALSLSRAHRFQGVSL